MPTVMHHMGRGHWRHAGVLHHAWGRPHPHAHRRRRRPSRNRGHPGWWGHVPTHERRRGTGVHRRRCSRHHRGRPRRWRRHAAERWRGTGPARRGRRRGPGLGCRHVLLLRWVWKRRGQLLAQRQGWQHRLDIQLECKLHEELNIQKTSNIHTQKYSLEYLKQTATRSHLL